MTAGFRTSYYVVPESTTSRYYVRNDTNAFPPELPQGPYPSPPTYQRGGSYFSRSFNSNVVVVMAVLLFALVVAAFINTVARCILRRRRPQPPDDHATTDKGLDKSAIEALPVVAYGADSEKALFDPAGGNECVVCLSEFVHGEKLRLLPDCQHGFHLGCIDTWLCTHTSCPVCRRSVLPATPVACSDDSDDPACAGRSVLGGSSRFGSARFGSARIASVDIEIEPSGANSSNASNVFTTTDPAQASSSNSSSSASRPNKRSLAAILSTEAMATIIHGVGPRRFGNVGRSQNPV